MAAPDTMALKQTFEQMRISVLGDSGIGKECLVRRYCLGMFINEYDPTDDGDGYRHQCVISETRCMITVDNPRPFGNSFVASRVGREADALVFAYDGTKPSSIDVLRSAKDNLQPHFTGSAFPPIVVVATKSDRAEELGEGWEEGLAAGRELANQLGVPFFVTSSVTGEGVGEAMEDLATKVLQNRAALEREGANHDEVRAEGQPAGGKRRSKLCCFA
ncbi:P-loop containing nucleoside triphosphate hydrolase protein [Ilyonectria robusta]|uniref:P-loop containing nucleoside triphosphate hydrolase protein n=1 Tax=Ilyonectria robusta TaxID=1079257 RepID=UPI001E8E1D9F|nr:P-loop containing nucleoside triphosphate hydrolase protein [Ilyonectria robusta]KAH8699759.1 P-loop containing nucleoside triphosphate hydrolase protein [Ilyonectria robusta]